MNKLYLLLLTLLYSCHEENLTFTNHNEKLLFNEMQTLEMCYVSHPPKIGYRYDLAQHIYREYKKLNQLILINSDSIKFSLKTMASDLNYFKIDNELTDNLLHLRDIKDKRVQILQLQFIVLYALKELREGISNTDFSGNICQIESLKEGTNFRLIISKEDSSEYPDIRIGKLNDNGQFIDSFIRPEFRNGYGYISQEKFKFEKSFEGLYNVPLNNGTTHTIRFKCQIK